MTHHASSAHIVHRTTTATATVAQVVAYARSTSHYVPDLIRRFGEGVVVQAVRQGLVRLEPTSCPIPAADRTVCFEEGGRYLAWAKVPEPES